MTEESDKDVSRQNGADEKKDEQKPELPAKSRFVWDDEDLVGLTIIDKNGIIVWLPERKGERSQCPGYHVPWDG